MIIKNIYSLLFVSFLTPTLVSANSWRLRAREHFESHSIRWENETHIYKGLSNTLDLLYESPFDLSWGVSLSPVLANLSSKEDQSLGAELTYFTLGVQAKYFPFKKDFAMFLRPGLGYSEVLIGGGPFGRKTGHFVYLGVGYEFLIGSVGLAFEFAGRHSQLEGGSFINSVTPSIGVHFYMF